MQLSAALVTTPTLTSHSKISQVTCSANRFLKSNHHIVFISLCVLESFSIKKLGYVAGIETFEGKYLHSWDYKGPEDMYGKRVVVIGIGNSGGDIAVETSRVAEQVEKAFLLSLSSDLKKNSSFMTLTELFLILQVYMSTRRGAWVIRQVSDNGVPVDMKYNTRFVHILFQLFPINFFNWFGEKKLNAMYDHTMYALKPKHRWVLSSPHRLGQANEINRSE